MQETERQSAMLVFQPVFASILPVQENANAGGDAGRLRGFVLGVLRLQTLLDRALLHGIHAVSYTHLDVYKRQALGFTHVASAPLVRSSYHADVQAKGAGVG